MKNIIIVMLLSLALGFIIGRSNFFFKSQNNISIVKLRRDTILQKEKPLILEKVKTKIIKIKDTIILTKPFKAIVDTVVRSDTIFASFEYPHNYFSLSVKSKPDTIKTYSIIYRQLNRKKEIWWHKPLIIVGAITAGYLLGKSTK